MGFFFVLKSIAFGGALWPYMFRYINKIKIPALDRFGEKVKDFFANLFKKEDKKA